MKDILFLKTKIIYVSFSDTKFFQNNLDCGDILCEHTAHHYTLLTFKTRKTNL